jgi:hypothetical protein
MRISGNKHHLIMSISPTFLKMKSIPLVLMLFLPFLLQAQNNTWRVYPTLGVDMGGALPFPLSDIPDGSKGTPKLNPNLGLGFEHGIGGKWSLGMEVSYHILAFSANADVISQPFYFDNQEDVLYFSGHTSTDVELRLLEFPVMAVFNAGPNWSLIMGAYYSRILDGTFNTTGTDGVLSPDKAITDTTQLPGPANITYNFNDYIDDWDAGLLIGYRYNLNHRIFFWTRFQVGFKSIFVKEFENIEYELYQLRLNVGISVALFSKKD